MVNPNKYKTRHVECYSIEITREDLSYQTYILMKNQLVSILRINPKTGKAEVYRGRIESFITQTRRSVYEDKLLFAVKLDISSKHQSEFFVITVESILEINPIDWEYQNLDKVVIQSFPDDWYEKDRSVSAPSSIYEFRLEGI